MVYLLTNTPYSSQPSRSFSRARSTYPYKLTHRVQRAEGRVGSWFSRGDLVSNFGRKQQK